MEIFVAIFCQTSKFFLVDWIQSFVYRSANRGIVNCLSGACWKSMSYLLLASLLSDGRFPGK